MLFLRQGLFLGMILFLSHGIFSQGIFSHGNGTEFKRNKESQGEVSTTFLGKQGAWGIVKKVNFAYVHCYMFAFPLVYDENYVNRGQVIFYVARHNTTGNTDEISVLGGSLYQESSSPALEIDGERRYILSPVGSYAWVTEKNRYDVVSNLHTAQKISVFSQFKQGDQVEDIFDVQGFSEAYILLEKACPR